MAGYDFKRSEEAMLAFWAEHKTYEKAKRRTAKGKRFYFLDGPPYTSGKVHLGTAWNKALKDMVLRYKRMQGLNVWDRAGYDMHGLPTENATQKMLNLPMKEDIERFGIAEFITECRKLSIENMHVMTGTFRRMGVWMDFDNANQSITEGFIEAVWWLVKRAHEEGRLYEGLKTMTWCPYCASALAKHECEYEVVKEQSIFVKFPVEGKKDTYLIIWTTTPWTIPFNLAIMANPELSYQRCLVTWRGKKEHWILSTPLAGPVIQGVADATYEVEAEFEGSKLEGLRYTHPFQKLLPYAEMRTKHAKLHTVIMSTEYVDTSAGSGLVHCAPGCGPEDYEVGVANGLPPYNTLDEKGVFDGTMNIFAGTVAKKDDDLFVQALEREGALLATADVEHDYAHCWRCHTPVIYRATRQWFFKVEDLKEQMITENDKIRWVPQAAYNAFDSWLRNLRDNSITKQRYWGTPIPIWRCDACNHYIVIGSKKELARHAGTKGMPNDLHKPWIDDVTWNCGQPGCSGTMRRIPDVIDVWVDAGTVSWSCLDYPQKEKHFKELFPADFILEGKDQIRGWFNLLHVASMLAFGRPSFKSVYMHGFISDSQGRKMSKSLGNYILPDEVIEKYGANTLRYYAIGAANLGLDMNYNLDDVELKHRNLVVFWNLHNLLLELRTVGGIELKKKGANQVGIEERFLLSRLHSTIKAATKAMEEYRLNEVPELIESLLLDMSRSYIQLVREKMAHGSDEEKEAVLFAAFTTYIEAMKLIAIVSPLFAEQTYQDLKREFGLKEESIHLCGWPEHDEKLINKELESDFSLVFDLIGAILAARDAAGLGVRWPSPELVVETDDQTRAASERLHELLKQQVNVKLIIFGRFPKAPLTVEPNYRSIGKQFGHETGKVIEFIKRNESKIASLVEQADEGKVSVDGYEFTRDHFNVTRAVPTGWSMGTFPKGTVFLHTALTPSLEAEGFSREIIRRVQQLRKEAGLQRSDVIELALEAPELASSIQAFEKEILRRTGATKLHQGPFDAAAYQHHADAKIKGKRVTLGLRKL
jgi:isoleucyl-tRNA synthetase